MTNLRFIFSNMGAPFIFICMGVFQFIVQDPLYIVFYLFFVAGLILFSISIFFYLKYTTNTYDKYKEENPDAITKHGIKCKYCGGNRIHIRNLYKRTYHRAHICNQCGKTLYYSPE